MARKIKSLMVVVGLLVGSLLGVKAVFADFDGMDTVMTISPPSQKLILTPGEDYEGSISVSNSSNAKYDLEYSVVVGSLNYGKDEEGKTDYEDLDVDEITGYNQIMNWIELKKKSGVIAKGDREVIPFVIHVPENAPAGGQYATIIVQDDSVRATGGEGVAIESAIRFASNIYATIAGETEDKGVIVENNIPSFLLSNSLPAVSLVKNDGNVHTDAKYTLQVWSIFSDEEVCTNEEKEEGSRIEGGKTSLIMPGTERYHTQTCYLPSIGVYRAKQTVTIFGEESVVEKMVIFCPLWLLFLILFAIVAFIVWIVMKFGKNSKRHKDE